MKKNETCGQNMKRTNSKKAKINNLKLIKDIQIPHIITQIKKFSLIGIEIIFKADFGEILTGIYKNR